MSFLNKPFIPDKLIKTAVISCECPNNIITAFEKYNIKIIKTINNNDINDSISSHADLQIHVFKNTAIVAPFAYEYYNKILTDFKVIHGFSEVQGSYPNDISYNITVVNNNLIHNIKYTDEFLLDFYKKQGYGILNVNQGYTKCTTCIVSDNAIITEDCGVAEIMKNKGFDVLVISSGDVVLKGYKYGFLGGASGLIDKNVLAFCGNIESHRDHNRIKSFAQSHGVDIISLSNDCLIDVGSVIPIYQ